MEHPKPQRGGPSARSFGDHDIRDAPLGLAIDDAGSYPRAALRLPWAHLGLPRWGAGSGSPTVR
jgi:hypothetical protein